MRKELVNLLAGIQINELGELEQLIKLGKSIGLTTQKQWEKLLSAENPIAEADSFLTYVTGYTGKNSSSRMSTLSYESVAEIADRLYRKHGVISAVDIQIEICTQHDGMSVGQHLSAYARKHKLVGKVSIGSEGIYKSRHAYFKGKKRPKLLGEKVQDYLNVNESPTHGKIKSMTGLSDEGVRNLMLNYFHYVAHGKDYKLRHTSR